MIVCPQNDDVGFGGPTFVGRVLEDAVPEEAEPGEAEPGEAEPGEAVPEEAIPEEAIPEEAEPEEAEPEEVALKEVVFEEAGSEDTVLKPDLVKPQAVELEAVGLETAVFGTPLKISVLSTKRSPEESADITSPRIVTAAEPGKIVVLSRTTFVGLMVNNSVEIVMVSNCRSFNLCALAFASRSKPTMT